MNFAGRGREGGPSLARISTPRSPFCPSLLSRRVLPHRPLHCSVGQSRLRLRRACGIARGARAFSLDRRDGPIRPNSHEFATEQATERCCRPRGYKEESWNDARETWEKETRARDWEWRRKGRRIRARSPRVDSTYEAKCAAGGKNRGICRRPPETGYRGVHSISAISARGC